MHRFFLQSRMHAPVLQQVRRQSRSPPKPATSSLSSHGASTLLNANSRPRRTVWLLKRMVLYTKYSARTRKTSSRPCAWKNEALVRMQVILAVFGTHPRVTIYQPAQALAPTISTYYKMRCTQESSLQDEVHAEIFTPFSRCSFLGERVRSPENFHHDVSHVDQ